MILVAVVEIANGVGGTRFMLDENGQTGLLLVEKWKTQKRW